MGRKVAQIGPSTLMVSLPSKWVKQQKIKKGDEITVTERGNALILQQETSSSPPEAVTINLANMNTTVAWYYLTAAYRSGVEEIHIETPSPIIKDEKNKETKDTFAFIKSVVNSFIGIEIMRHANNICTLKEISSIKEDELETMQRRIFFSLTNTFEDILAAFAKKDKKALEYIFLHADTNINKFSDYCLRILAKTGNKHPTTYTSIIQLEEIGDALKHIAYHIMQKEGTKEELQLLKELKEIFALVEKFYYTNSGDIFVNFEKERRAIRETLFSSKHIHPTLGMLITNMLNRSLAIANARLLQPL